MKNAAVRRGLAMAVAVLLLALPVLLAGLYVLDRYRTAEGQLAALEPRYARLQGIQARRADLDKTDHQASEVLAQYAYPASQEVSQAGNDAQQRLRTILSGAGLEVVSSQVLAAKAEKDFDRIPLVVRADGDLVALQSALVVLAGQSPAILVEGFSMQVVGALRADKAQRLTSQFNLSVLRARP